MQLHLPAWKSDVQHPILLALSPDTHTGSALSSDSWSTLYAACLWACSASYGFYHHHHCSLPSCRTNTDWTHVHTCCSSCTLYFPTAAIAWSTVSSFFFILANFKFNLSHKSSILIRFIVLPSQSSSFDSWTSYSDGRLFKTWIMKSSLLMSQFMSLSHILIPSSSIIHLLRSQWTSDGFSGTLTWAPAL